MFIEVRVKLPWKPPLLLFNSIFIKHLYLSDKIRKLLLINIMGFYFFSTFCPKFLKLDGERLCQDAEGAACQCFLFNIFTFQVQ